MRVWTYVIRDDVGGAPNLAPPAPTLVICKPEIRKGATIGDIVLAFNGAQVFDLQGPQRFPDPNTVRWAGIVSRTMSLADYWDDPHFKGKKPGAAGMPDNLYRAYQDGYVQQPNESHGPERQARDVRGRNALVFATSWYFGREAPSLPEAFGLWMGGARGGGRQGHRCPQVEQERADQLIAWLDAQPQAERVLPQPSGMAGSTCRPAPARYPGRCSDC